MRLCFYLLPALLLASGCTTSVPASRTTQAYLDALVGQPPRAAYLRYGAPVRETSDGDAGRIVRWEWAHTHETPGTTTATTTTDTSGATVASVATTSATQHTDVHFVELFVGPEGRVYHYRTNLRSPEEARAARNRSALYTSGAILGLIGVAALTCATNC